MNPSDHFQHQFSIGGTPVAVNIIVGNANAATLRKGADGDVVVVHVSRAITSDFDCDDPHAVVDGIAQQVVAVMPSKPTDADTEALRDGLFEWLCEHREAASIAAE